MVALFYTRLDRNEGNAHRMGILLGGFRGTFDTSVTPQQASSNSQTL